MIDAMLKTMSRFPDLLFNLVQGLSDEDLDWRPVESAWSIADILDHIYLEEVQDFRPRLHSTLDDPTAEWPGLDAQVELETRRAQPHHVVDTLNAFRDERGASVTWLSSLNVGDWDRAYEHPKLGSMRAGDLLAAWAAHDELHLRQLAHRRFQRIQNETRPYSTAYAGNWPAAG